MVNDVTVLGAGIVGISTGLSLLERGLNVRLIDRDDPGQATSFGNAGVISPWSIVPQSMPGLWKKIPGWLIDPLGPVTVRPGHLPRMLPWGLRFLAYGREDKVRDISAAMEMLNRDCVSLYRQHLAGTGHEDLIRDSHYIHAFRDGRAARLDSLENELRRGAGAELDRVDGEELRQLEPALSEDFEAAIVIKGQARAISPGRLGQVLSDKFRRQGGELLRATVQSIHPLEQGGWSCITDQGSYQVPKLVLAMGVWSAELLKPLGIRIPLQSERGYHINFSAPGITLNNSVMDVDNKFVASTMEQGLRVAGTAEFAGLDSPVNEKRLAALIQVAGRLSPHLRTDDYSTWSGQRPSLPDSLPCIGEIDGFPDLITAFGHSHYGLMMAAKTGRIVADIATGATPNVDLSSFSPTRF
ncbi:NAD(P)/FAD-dependent oxidoreductase [Roseovarius nitratireducens]|uniref:NAD(P)/FAD-dependent oxidoreductase n=1 Tax=Roseovarius nitratireducens TaxID=2044597 RepID=UPI000CE259DF|nr:FAD-dependent oxidoreductase [Roseovarius nitratireducens]